MYIVKLKLELEQKLASKLDSSPAMVKNTVSRKKVKKVFYKNQDILILFP